MSTHLEMESLPLILEHSTEISQCMLALKAYVKMESERRNIQTYTTFEKIPSYLCF